MLVIEIVERIRALWGEQLTVVLIVSGDFIPVDFCDFVLASLADRNLTDLHVAKRHMLSVTCQT